LIEKVFLKAMNTMTYLLKYLATAFMVVSIASFSSIAKCEHVDGHHEDEHHEDEHHEDEHHGDEHHGGDIELQVVNGQIVTNKWVYAAELGEISPNEVDEPGFDNSSGTFSAGSKIGFSILDSLREWDGHDFENIANETMSVHFGTSLGPVVTPDQPSVVSGFELPVSEEGEWHRHYDFVLNAPADTGIYLLQLQLSSDDPEVQETEPFVIVFNQNESELHHDAAIEFAELQFNQNIPEPSALLLISLGLALLSTRVGRKRG